MHAFGRGPGYGYKGKVLLAFGDNGSSKIGVRFNKQIPECNDLGGIWEEDHGLVCAGKIVTCNQFLVWHYIELR